MRQPRNDLSKKRKFDKISKSQEDLRSEFSSGIDLGRGKVRCKRGWLKVVVLDGFGQPLPGVDVEATGRCLTTDGDGVADFGKVRCASYEVRAHRDGYVPFIAKTIAYVRANTVNGVGLRLSAAQLTALTVVLNATQDDVTGANNWAAVKKATDDVIVQVTTNPDTEDAWRQVDWFGTGAEVQDHLNQRAFSRAESKKLVARAALGGVQRSLDIWILWAEVTILADQNDTTPSNAVQFGNRYDGTENLGVRTYSSGNAATAKIIVVGKLTPAGVGAVVQAGWDIKRRRMSRDWCDGVKDSEGNGPDDNWNTAWVDDTSFPKWKRLTPDNADQIYDRDAPNIEAFGRKNAETYNNFEQWITWRNDEVCSDVAGWYWQGRWEKKQRPQVTLAEVGLGRRDLPDDPHYSP